MVGAKRKSHVERQERDCKVHGRTDFACRLTGRTGCKSWYCMLCHSELQKDRREAKKNGTFEPTYNKNPKHIPRDYGQCEKHFLALNALGECIDCED